MGQYCRQVQIDRHCSQVESFHFVWRTSVKDYLPKGLSQNPSPDVILLGEAENSHESGLGHLRILKGKVAFRPVGRAILLPSNNGLK